MCATCVCLSREFVCTVCVYIKHVFVYKLYSMCVSKEFVQSVWGCELIICCTVTLTQASYFVFSHAFDLLR